MMMTLAPSMTDIRRHALTLLVWTLSLLLTSSLTAYLAYVANQRANSQLAIQQQMLSDLQQFRNSGGEVDGAVRAFSDALVEGAHIGHERAELRAAVAKHAVDTTALQERFGANATEAYLKQLAQLRAIADKTETVIDGRELWQSALHVIVARQKMAASAQGDLS